MFRKSYLIVIVALVAIAAAACSSAVQEDDQPVADEQVAVETTAEDTSSASIQGSTDAASPRPSPAPLLVEPPLDLGTPGGDAPARLTRGWDNTDFTKHSVPFDEIVSGGPPRDGIRPIDDPQFVDVKDAPSYMRDSEPVVSVEINGDARAYPLAMLMQHEIVNDVINGQHVTVTFCPLCNTAIAFDRNLDGLVLDFGTSGNLRNSDLVMWDRQTESWWQQITGEAIVGELTGKTLTMIPASIVSWDRFKEAFPDGKLLSREQGFERAYNYDYAPYAGYDQVGNLPFFWSPGLGDDRLLSMERVLSMQIDGQAVAYSFGVLGDHPVVNDTINGQDVVIFYFGGTLSPFTDFSGFREDIGSTAVFNPVLDGQKLTFTEKDGKIVDEQTGSSWDAFGSALQGPLAGKDLDPIIHANHFWFAWASFNPETLIRGPEDFAMASKQ